MPGPAKGTGGALRKISWKAGKKETEVKKAKGKQDTLTSMFSLLPKPPQKNLSLPPPHGSAIAIRSPVSLKRDKPEHEQIVQPNVSVLLTSRFESFAISCNVNVTNRKNLRFTPIFRHFDIGQMALTYWVTQNFGTQKYIAFK